MLYYLSVGGGGRWADYVIWKNVSDWTLKGKLKESHVGLLPAASRPQHGGGRGLQDISIEIKLADIL